MHGCLFLRGGRLLLLAAGLLLGNHAAAAEEDSAAWTMRDERFTHPLKAGTPVCITNLVGDVRVRETVDPSLTVVAMIQQRREDPRRAVITRGDVLPCQLEATFPGDAPADLYPPGRAPRVDLTVMVPPGAAITIVTAGGRIEAKGVSGDVTARSDTGRIVIRTPGVIDAVSRRGDVDVRIGDLGRGRVFRVFTEAGRASVRLPATGAATVRVTTTGRIASDYSMAVARTATSTHKQATIHYGASRLGRWLFGWAARRSQVDLGSEQGDLAVLSPFPELEDP